MGVDFFIDVGDLIFGYLCDEKEVKREDAGYFMGGAWMFPDLKKKGLNFGVAPLPKKKFFATNVGTEWLVILNKENKENSWKFISWITSANVYSQICILTSYSKVKQELIDAGAKYIDAPVVRDKNIITPKFQKI